MNRKLRLLIALTLMLTTALALQAVEFEPASAVAPSGASEHALLSGETTDVIQVGLDMVRQQGLADAPRAIYVASGLYRDFRLSAVEVPVTDTRRVWVVWVQGHYYLKHTLAGPVAVDNTICYIDAGSGMRLGCMGGPGMQFGPSASDDFSRRPWTRVTTNDIGRYPVPVWTGDADPGPMPTLTPTPTLVGTPMPTATPHP